MLKITYVAIFGIIFFILLSPSNASASPLVLRELDNSYSYGTHPWNARPRRNYYAVNAGLYRYPKEYFYTHPDRAKTFALHPYHRGNYYAPPVDPEYARYSINRKSDVLYAQEHSYVPQPNRLASCDNYSFRRPNYRVPPYRYFCTQK